MRKQMFFVASLIVAIASVCVAQETTATPSPAAKPRPAMSRTQSQNKIIAMEKKLWDAWKNKNWAAFKADVWSGAVMIGNSGVTDKEAMLKDLASSPCEVRSYELSDIKVAWFDSNTAVITYKATQDATCGGTAVPPTVWASSVYVRRGGRWYAATHQETPATP